MGNNRIWHPSFGWLTRTEVENLNAMKDDCGKQRRKIEKTAEKEAKQIPFPPLKSIMAAAALLAITSPAAAEPVLVCGADEFRAVIVTGRDGDSVTVEHYCEKISSHPTPQQHPTFAKEAPPVVTEPEE